MPAHDLTVPLIPRRRIAALPYGTMRSRRRGVGLDLVGARAYRPGDDARAIDHRASARRSSELGRDELIVREFATEEATRVVVLADGLPSMELFPDALPWLRKPRAVEEAGHVLAGSATAARCELRTEAVAREGLDEALRRLLTATRSLPAGAFLFLVSDMLEPPSRELLAGALARGWDVVPVITQDPTWERSFPDVGGTSIPVTDPASGRTRLVRLTPDEAADRRSENERRFRRLLAGLSGIGLDHVLIDRHDPGRVLAAFAAWSAGRRGGARSL